MDPDGRLVFANPALAAWTGLSLDQLIGGIFRFGAAAAASAPILAAAPEVLAGRSRRGPIWGIETNGRRPLREAQFLPLVGEGSPAILVVVDGADAAAEEQIAAADPYSAERLHQELVALRSKIRPQWPLDRVLGETPTVRRVRAQAELAAASNVNVVVTGPKGSGRRQIAEAIFHQRRPEDSASLLPLSSWLLDAELMQSTITAVARRAGGRLGRGAVLLMLEVDQLPADAQRELEGFLSLPDCELRVIATADEPLQQIADRGDYLPRLAHDLTTISIHLPPLASRKDDLPLLAQLAVERLAASGGPIRQGFSPPAMELILGYRWPGEFEELEAAVKEAATRASGSTIGPTDLPSYLHHAAHAAAYPPKRDEPIVLDDFLLEVERELIERALARTKGNKSRAAELLGISRPRLLRRLEQWGLAAPDRSDAGEAPQELEPLEPE